MTDIVTRLRNPPFGTDTSERNLMSAAADEIERLKAALQPFADAFENAVISGRPPFEFVGAKEFERASKAVQS